LTANAAKYTHEKARFIFACFVYFAVEKLWNPRPPVQLKKRRANAAAVLRRWKSAGTRFARIALDWPDVAVLATAVPMGINHQGAEILVIFAFTACNFCFHRQILRQLILNTSTDLKEL
jgi:hypothetical protein